MRAGRRQSGATLWVLTLGLLGGCATQELAPIEQKTPQSQIPSRSPASTLRSGPTTDRPPAVYTVVAGDTLYAIAWRFGLDARDIGRWNRLDDFNRIIVGQKLKLRGAEPVPAARPLERESGLASPQRGPTPSVPGTMRALPPIEPASTADKKPTVAPLAVAPPVVAVPPTTAPAIAAAPPAAATEKPAVPPPPPAAEDDKAGAGRAAGGLVWRWPASGKSRPTVAATGAQGVDILAARGQPVMAAADGQVVYSGSGLRGYGQLIIIKHNDSFLSAYAHNDKLLVSEGTKVKAGQQIAHMGDSEADEVMLHFEIRKGGKAVEPLQFLPPR